MRLALVILVCACSTPAPTPSSGTSPTPPPAAAADAQGEAMLPTVKTADDLKANDGARVRLVGVYRKRMVQKKMNGPTTWLGHVEILVEGHPRAYNPTAWDGAQATVQLDYTSKRPEDEVARFEGKTVAVEGKLLLDPSVLDPPGDYARTKPQPALVELGPVALAE